MVQKLLSKQSNQSKDGSKKKPTATNHSTNDGNESDERIVNLDIERNPNDYFDTVIHGHDIRS